jgi:hypothetical protein
MQFEKWALFVEIDTYNKNAQKNIQMEKNVSATKLFFFFSVPVCVITASGVLGCTLVSMNRFSTLCG